MEQLTFDFERKIKNLEEKCKGYELNKKVKVLLGRTWRWKTRN